MCGRYQFSCGNSRALRRIVRGLAALPGNEPWEGGEVFPGQKAPVLLEKQGRLAATLFVWGFPGREKQGLVINARAESAPERPMFRSCVERRRCVVPCSGFYEWDATRHKYLFRRKGENEVYLAALYDRHEQQGRFCILTTAPNESVRGVHDRMPLVLAPGEVRPWLTDLGAALSLLKQQPAPLEKQSADGPLALW